jgi:hypothetical protein
VFDVLALTNLESRGKTSSHWIFIMELIKGGIDDFHKICTPRITGHHHWFFAAGTRILGTPAYWRVRFGDLNSLFTR